MDAAIAHVEVETASTEVTAHIEVEIAYIVHVNLPSACNIPNRACSSPYVA